MSYVIVFPGQGAQQVGMGVAFTTEPIYVEHLQLVDQMLDFELSLLMQDGPAEKLQQTLYAQLALFTMETGLYKLWREQVQVAPLAVAGHSLGEYSALVAAGVLDFEAALLLVRERAEAMQAACEQQSGSMAAVIRPDLARIERLCQSESLVVANYNSPNQIVLSGESQALEQACAEIEVQRAGKVIPLKVSGAFHSPLMQNAAKQLQKALSIVPFHSPSCPVVMNSSGQTRLDTELIRADLQAQMSASVLWQQSVLELNRQQPEQWIELGPSILCSLIKQSLAGVSVHAPQSMKDLILCAQVI